MSYQHILFACDLSKLNEACSVKAMELARLFNAKLSVVHVVEPPMVYPITAGAVVADLVDLMEEAAIESFTKICEAMHIAEENRYLICGQTKSALSEICKEIDADLLVLGTHGVGGHSAWLGSVASASVTRAPCDVLTIKVSQTQVDDILNTNYVKMPSPKELSKFKAELGKQKEKLTNKENWGKYVASKHGVKQNTQGPRPANRPPGTPYGKTPKEDDES